MCFRSRIVTRVSLSTAWYKAICFIWARHHRYWTVYDWKHVAWSDKPQLQLYQEDKRVQIWRVRQKSMKEQHVNSRLFRLFEPL